HIGYLSIAPALDSVSAALDVSHFMAVAIEVPEIFEDGAARHGDPRTVSKLFPTAASVFQRTGSVSAKIFKGHKRYVVSRTSDCNPLKIIRLDEIKFDDIY